MIFGLGERELHCGQIVPYKYWTDTGEVNEEGNVLRNDWITMIGSKPQDGRPYEASEDGTWVDVTTQEDIRKEDILAQELLIEEAYKVTCNAPVLFNGVIYKGGESSAGGIANAVSIAQGCNEATVWITDVNRVKRKMTHAEATAVAIVIGKVPRDAFLVRADALVEISS